MAEQLLTEDESRLFRDLDRRLRNMESSQRIVSLHNRVVRCRRAAAQVVAPSATVDVLFDVEDEDPEGWIAVTASTLTVSQDGFYAGFFTRTISAGSFFTELFLATPADVLIQLDASSTSLNWLGFMAAGTQFKFHGVAQGTGVTFTARLDIARVSF